MITIIEITSMDSVVEHVGAVVARTGKVIHCRVGGVVGEWLKAISFQRQVRETLPMLLVRLKADEIKQT